MAELKDVLGAVLKDLAHSRVIGDRFSGEISHEYDADPILGVFPVPRVEIREASINLKFAVNAVERRQIDLSAATRAVANRRSEEFAGMIFQNLIRRHPQAAEILRVIEAKNLNLEGRLRTAAEAAILGDQNALEAARNGNPEELAKRTGGEVAAVLLEDADLKRLLASRGFRVTTIRVALQEMANAVASRVGAELAAAVAAAERQPLGIDVAVTRKELAETPELLISQVGVVVQIRNYEWVEVGEEGGKPVKRLRPE